MKHIAALARWIRDLGPARRIAFFLTCGIAFCNVLLLTQNFTLRHQIATLDSRDVDVPIGRTLAAIRGVNMDDRLEAVPSDVPLLVITFSPACPVSQSNQARWQELARKLRGTPRKVVWLSRDPLAPTREYAARRQIDGLVLVDVPHRTYAQLGLRFVPQTAAVGPGGVVEKVWKGRLDDQVWRDLNQFVGLPIERAALH